MPSSRRAPIDPQAQDLPKHEPTAAVSNDLHGSFETSAPHALPGDYVAHSAYNPFRLSGQTTTLPLEMSAVLEEPSISSSGNMLKGRQVNDPQRRPNDLAGLPRYSTLLPTSSCGTHPVGNVTASMGAINVTSPAPRYTAQGHTRRPAEKQSAFRSSVASVAEEDEKLNLRSSPVQEQDHSLPFHRDEDVDVVKMGNARLYNHLNMEEDILHLVAVSTKEYERYKRGYCYPEKFWQPEVPTIDPLTTSFDAPALPEGWKVFVHPEGTRYFYCDHASNPVPVLTEAWLYDLEQYAQICDYMRQIFQYMGDHKVSFRNSTPSPHAAPLPRKKRRSRNGSFHFQPTSSDAFEDFYPQHLAPIVLVLELRLTGNTGYYFVSHPTQTTFWLDPFDFSIAVGEVHVEHTSTMIGLEMKSHYWTHNDFFPHLYELEEKDIEEVDDMIGFAIGDALTSVTGVATIYSPEQLKQLQSIVHRYEMKRWEKRRRSVGERRMIFRVISDFYHERFLNLHGEQGARLDCKQSIHYSPYRRHKYVSAPSFVSAQRIPWYRRLLQSPFQWKAQAHDDDGEKRVQADPPIEKAAKEMHHSSTWMHMLSLVMFGGPGVHMKRLRDMTVDRVVSKTVLAKYMERMMEEWRDVTLYGTVLLGANVSFLTIQSVDDAGKDGPNRTPSQRASYFSILASMGTIVSSFMLLGRHREVMSYTFIAHRSNSRWGLESLALMYGMPFSLAIWSIISFFLSFAILWFDNTDYVVMGLVGSFALLFTFFLFWAVLAPYEKDPYEFFVSRAAERVRVAGKKLRKGSLKAVKSMTRKMSSAGGVTMGNETQSPPQIARNLPTSAQPSPTHDAFEPAGRSSMSSSIVQRAIAGQKHKRSWSDPSVTVEGDEDPPGAVQKKSLDIGQGEGVSQKDEKKAVKFDSLV